MDRSLSSVTYVSLQIANLYNHVLTVRSQLALALERSTGDASTTHLGRFIFQYFRTEGGFSEARIQICISLKNS